MSKDFEKFYKFSKSDKETVDMSPEEIQNAIEESCFAILSMTPEERKQKDSIKANIKGALGIHSKSDIRRSIIENTFFSLIFSTSYLTGTLIMGNYDWKKIPPAISFGLAIDAGLNAIEIYNRKKYFSKAYSILDKSGLYEIYGRILECTEEICNLCELRDKNAIDKATFGEMVRELEERKNDLVESLVVSRTNYSNKVSQRVIG